MEKTADKFQEKMSCFEIIKDTQAKAKARFEALLSSSASASVLKIVENNASSTPSSFPSSHSSKTKKGKNPFPVTTFGSSPAPRDSHHGSTSNSRVVFQRGQNGQARLGGVKRERFPNTPPGTPSPSTKSKSDPISNSEIDRRAHRLDAGPNRWNPVNEQTKNRYGCDKDGFLVCSYFATRKQCTRAQCAFSHLECVDKNPNFSPRLVVRPYPSSSQSTN
jgi:hypothetical protein